MQRVYTVLDDYGKLIERHGADTAVAVLTSAVRDAANGQEFARAGTRALGSRAARAERRRGGAADLPGRHQRAQPV